VPESIVLVGSLWAVRIAAAMCLCLPSVRAASRAEARIFIVVLDGLQFAIWPIDFTVARQACGPFGELVGGGRKCVGLLIEHQ